MGERKKVLDMSDNSRELHEQRKKMVLDFIHDEQYKPMKLKEMAFFLQVEPQERAELKRILKELMEEGYVDCTAKGKYVKLEQKAMEGIFESTSRGFGFVRVEGLEGDIFIPSDRIHGALHQDRVLVSIDVEARGDKRSEGTILKVLERGMEQIVGTFEKSKNFGFVIPDNAKYGKDIFIPKEYCKQCVSGHKVVVQITNFGQEGKKPEGKVIEILGHIDDPGVDIMSIIKAFGLPTDFPKGVEQQLKVIPSEVDTKDMAGRLDLRELQTVTIDGEDAKDLDDAITIQKNGELYRLGVHIADVTNYVKEGSPLDVEALKRGTSVYLVDRVIPMLPHQLSNGICSLNQGTDRLALSCIMDIDSKGKVVDHKIAETVIRVDRRMSYTAVNEILTNQNKEVMKEYEELLPMFYLMKELADLLREKRHQRGSIDFDFPESKIILDPNGRPIEIKPYDRNSATKIIEDFMLIANETVAEDYFWQEMPFVYRTHDNPDPEKIQKLSIFINNFGYFIKSNQEVIHPKEIQKLLDKIEGTAEEALISRLTLRSMKQAKYTTINTGHFGLSTKYYCHFTSPIRRYPDLQIHRIIKENLHGQLNGKRLKHYESILSHVADRSSQCERRADEAEREVDKLKKVDYMSERIGQIYDGVISSITSWGMYVELPNTVEGMIHVTALLDDYYYYDEERYVMVGQDTGREFKLGQQVKIRVKATDKMLRTIDFELYEPDEGAESMLNEIREG